MSTRDSVKILLDAAIDFAQENDVNLDPNDIFDPSLLDEFEEECANSGDRNCKFLRVEAMAKYIEMIGKVCEEFADAEQSATMKLQLLLLVNRAKEASKVIAAAWYIIECADDAFFCDVKHTQYMDDLETIRRFVLKMRKPPQRKIT
jgi:hypothetical protein